MIRDDIINYDESVKREYESNYLNDKFFEMFPTKYEEMLREYETIYFKKESEIAFFNFKTIKQQNVKIKICKII